MKVNEYNEIAYRNMQEKFKVSDTAAVIQDSGNMAMILKWLIAKPKKSFLFLAPNSTIMKRLQKSIELNGYKMTDFPNLKCALYEQLLHWDNSDFNFHYDNIIFTLFHHAGDLRWSKAIQKLLSSNPNSKLLGISSISPSDLDNKNMIDILFEENVVFEKGGAIVEKTLPKKYKFTKKIKSNIKKLTIIESYLSKGKNYEDIVKSTKDEYGNAIGQWIDAWRSGHVKLNGEERDILMSMGETFQPKIKPKKSNIEKLTIIENYLSKGNNYEDIIHSTKDEEDNPLGRWIEKWRSGQIKLTKEERIVLMSLGETFEPKRRLAVYSIKDNCTLEKGGIKSSKVKKR